jgi:hypothetical protein
MDPTPGVWFLLAGNVALVYLLPGFALQSVVKLRGVGWGGRIVLAICLSIVVVPFSFVTVGNVMPFRPNMIHLCILSAILLLGGLALKVAGRRPTIVFRPRNAGAWPPTLAEWILAACFVIGFAALVNLPRIDMLAHGDQAVVAATFDEYWHIAELTSLARSGIPPSHYFFPDSNLVHYYWSWVIPATVANGLAGHVALARSMAVQSFVQVVMFLGLAYVLIRANTRSRLARAMGIGFFSIIGGFDYFTTMTKVEQWQGDVPWLHSRLEFSSFPTLYEYVPQHLAGGFAVLVGLVVWRNARANKWIRAGSIGVLLAFAFGTSAYVFMFAVLALAVWGFLYRRAVVGKGMVTTLGMVAALLVIGGWRQGLLTLSHSGHIVLSNFRVPLVESFLGVTTGSVDWVDRVLTLSTFPVVGTWIMLIEYGVGFAIYFWWLVSRRWREQGVWGKFGAVFPILSLFLVFLLRDDGGGNNFAMRGFIPGQIIMAVFAAEAVDHWNLTKMGSGTRVAMGYAIVTAILAGGVSWGIGLQTLARGPLGSAFQVEDKVRMLGVDLASRPRWPAFLDYIHWINANTPEDALVIEVGPLPEDDPRFRMLERMRFVALKDAQRLTWAFHDFELAPADLVTRVGDPNDDEDVLEQARQSAYFRSRHPPVYLVARGGQYSEFGVPVYQDEFAAVYEISLK